MDRKRKMDDQNLPPSSSNHHHVADDENDDTFLTTLSLSNHPSPTVPPRLPSPSHQQPRRYTPPQPSQIHPSHLPPLQPLVPTQFHHLYFPENTGYPFITADNNFYNQPLYPAMITVPPPLDVPSPSSAGNSRSGRGRGRRIPVVRTPLEGRSATITPPFPWATTDRATVHSLNYLLGNKISAVSGDVQCRRCERQYSMQFDLQQKFNEVAAYISANKSSMHHRAPKIWLSPPFPKCQFCDQENSVRPIIADKKRSINWLFLLLGQMLGCCTLEQLKYFCKHTKNHRTGAKDRVLYLAYLALCKQLDPRGPFDI